MIKAKRQNYKEVKNYIHNELKITREDIRDMIKDNVRDEIQRLVSNKSTLETFIGEEFKKEIKVYYGNGGQWNSSSAFTTTLRKTIEQKIAELVLTQVNINISQIIKD